MANYEKEIKECLRDVYKAAWLTDDEVDCLIVDSLKGAGITIKQLSEDLEVGVKNGMTVKDQLSLVRALLKKMDRHC